MLLPWQFQRDPNCCNVLGPGPCLQDLFNTVQYPQRVSGSDNARVTVSTQTSVKGTVITLTTTRVTAATHISVTGVTGATQTPVTGFAAEPENQPMLGLVTTIHKKYTKISEHKGEGEPGLSQEQEEDPEAIT